MHIYGHCPAHDDIYLVVCSLCGHVIKPQAFEKHCDRWHGPLNMRCSQSSDLPHQQGARPGPSLWNLSSSKETTTNGRCHEASSSHIMLPVHQRRSTETRKESSRYEEMNEKTMLHASVRHSRTRTYGHTHKDPNSKSLLSDVCMLQHVESRRCPPILLFPTESKCDMNGLCRDLAAEKKRKLCSQEPISNVNSVLQLSVSVVLLIMLIHRLVRNKTALVLAPGLEDKGG